MLRALSLTALLMLALIPSVPCTEETDETKLTFDWLYNEAHKARWGLPRNEAWSNSGHALGYLIADTTEEPDLRVFDPVSKMAPVWLTPQSLAGLVDDVSDATRAVRIHSFSWLEEDDVLRLNTSDGAFRYTRSEHTLAPIETVRIDGSQRTESDDGRYIAYTRDFDVYAFDTEQQREIRLTHGGSETLRNGVPDWVYPEELDLRSGIFMSPDGLSVAYLQFDETGVSTFPVVDYSTQVPTVRTMFYPKAGTKNPSVRVGIVRLSNQQTTWVDLGEPFEYIARVVWSPDSSTLALVVLNRAQNVLSIRFADPATGHTREVFREESSDWIHLPRQNYPVFYGDKTDCIIVSNASGYRHLYGITRDGTRVKQLTDGDWDLTSLLTIHEDSRRIFYQAARNNPTLRHVYSVPLSGGRSRMVSRMEGHNTASVSADGRYLYMRHNSTHTPDLRTVTTDRGERLWTMATLTRKDYAPKVIPQQNLFTIVDEEGNHFRARTIYPPDFDAEKKYPVIVTLYGGPWGQVVNESFQVSWPQVFASQGYIVFSIDNRGSYNRGHAWEAPLYRRLGEIELADHVMGVEHMSEVYNFDTTRVGIIGWSYGGYMVLQAMMHAPDTFHAGASIAPVADWSLYDTIYTERYMGTPDDNPDGYHDSSPVNFAENLQGDLLIAHGIKDDNVHIQNAYAMIEALTEADKPYTFLAYPQGNHGIGNNDKRIYMFERILEFFNESLTHTSDESSRGE